MEILGRDSFVFRDICHRGVFLVCRESFFKAFTPQCLEDGRKKAEAARVIGSKLGNLVKAKLLRRMYMGGIQEMYLQNTASFKKELNFLVPWRNQIKEDFEALQSDDSMKNIFFCLMERRQKAKMYGIYLETFMHAKYRKLKFGAQPQKAPRKGTHITDLVPEKFHMDANSLIDSLARFWRHSGPMYARPYGRVVTPGWDKSAWFGARDSTENNADVVARVSKQALKTEMEGKEKAREARIKEMKDRAEQAQREAQELLKKVERASKKPSKEASKEVNKEVNKKASQKSQKKQPLPQTKKRKIIQIDTDEEPVDVEDSSEDSDGSSSEDSSEDSSSGSDDSSDESSSSSSEASSSSSSSEEDSEEDAEEDSD